VTKTRSIATGSRVYHSLTHLSTCFSGRLPTELGQLTALKQLNLYNNELTGECNQTCLNAIGNRVYHSVTHLFAWFSGRIPTELGQLAALAHLQLDNNKLTGACDYYKTRLIAIGQRLYHSLALTCLACFSGRIPTELGHLTALTQLWLNNNQLTGACDQNSPGCNW